MKSKYSIQLTDLRFQVDQKTPKIVQLFEEFNTDPLKFNARLFVILVSYRQFQMISDGNKIKEGQSIHCSYIYISTYI